MLLLPAPRQEARAYDENTISKINRYMNFVGSSKGDVKGDSYTDSRDLVRLMKYIAADGKDIEAKFPDVNEDGEVTTADLVRMMKMIAAG